MKMVMFNYGDFLFYVVFCILGRVVH